MTGLGFELNSDLKTTQKWAYNWNVPFKPDPNKQATEELSFKKNTKIDYPELIFNDNRALIITYLKNIWTWYLIKNFQHVKL